MRIHLVVDYLNGTTRYYVVPEDQGWRVDVMQRMIVVGRKVPRIMIPLDTVASIEIEECNARQEGSMDN
jgi:hypothetical protein